MMPSKYEIAGFWAIQIGCDFSPMLGSPGCFACDYHQSHWSRPRSRKKRWELATLERAHIIARSIGGPDDVSNLVLLCKECHKSAPMVSDPTIMFRWISARESWLDRLYHEVHEAAERLGITNERILEYGPVDHDLVKRIVADLNIGTHFSGETGSATSPGSALAIILRYVDVKEGRAPEPPAIEPEPVAVPVEVQPEPEVPKGCDLLYARPGHCEDCNARHLRALRRLCELADELRSKGYGKSADA